MRSHPDTSQISDFALGRLSPEESLKVLDAIENDPKASEQLDLIAGLINAAESQGAEMFGREAVARRAGWRWQNPLKDLGSFLPARKPAVASVLAGACIVLFLGVNLLSRLTAPEYYSAAKVDGAEYVSGVRGADEFAAAHALIARGETDEATSVLERYMRAFPLAQHIDYAHYLAGAAYLVSAHHSVLTLFPSFDRDRAYTAIRHLEAAAEHSGNLRIQEESHWLLAKAWLMLERPDAGLAELRQVLSMNGPRKTAALELSTELQRGK